MAWFGSSFGANPMFMSHIALQVFFSLLVTRLLQTQSEAWGTRRKKFHGHGEADHDGGKCERALRGRESKGAHACLANFFSAFLCHLGPHPNACCYLYSGQSSLLSWYLTCQWSLEMPLWTHSKIFFCDLLSISQPNQNDNLN